MGEIPSRACLIPGICFQLLTEKGPMKDETRVLFICGHRFKQPFPRYRGNTFLYTPNRHYSYIAAYTLQLLGCRQEFLRWTIAKIARRRAEFLLMDNQEFSS